MSSLSLYHLTLKKPSLSLLTISGQFAENKDVHIVISTSTGLDVLRPDAESGKLHKVASQNAFAHVTQMAKFRNQSGTKDLLVLLSDSGNLSVCELDLDAGKFVPVEHVAMAKPGMTRFSPISYVSINEKSRYVMAAALERTKLFYNLDHVTESPVEHSAKECWTLAVAALNTGPENSVWAAIETHKGDPVLNYYVLDHGLNHVFQRKASLAIPASSSFVVAMPGHLGGVLVCCESGLVWDQEYGSQSAALHVNLPVRRHTAATVITAAHVHTLKKNDFFVLLQSSVGDLYKVTASRDSLHVAYFDSLPPCSSFSVLKTGFLYANTLHGDKLLYQFESLGEENDTTESAVVYAGLPDADAGASSKFAPVGLQNLALVDMYGSLGPVVGGEFLNGPNSEPALQTLSSRFLKTLAHGYSVTPLVSSALPSAPSVIYTTKLFRASGTDQYLVLSSARDESTQVLSIGEVVEEVHTELVKDQYTLGVQQTGASSLVQVHRNGIRSIRHVVSDGVAKMVAYTDWFPPAGIHILHCSANNEQVVVALSNREVCYFEIDPEDDQLVEYQERMQVSEGSVTAVALCAGPARKSRFLAVASSDLTVQVVSLAPHDCFSVLTLQAVSFGCSTLLLTSSFLHMGMENGVYVRVAVDPVTGKLSDTRSKYLGAKPVQLRSFKLPDSDIPGILAISSRPWVGVFDASGNLSLSPLLDCSISCGSSFFSEDIGIESVVGIDGRNLTIFTVGGENGFDPGNNMQVASVKLRYQPRKMARSKRLAFVTQAEMGIESPYAGRDDVDAEYYDAFGYDRKDGSWASCVQVVDDEVLQTVEFGGNEAAGAVCVVGDHVIVACSSGITYAPHTSTAHYLYTFQLVNRQLQLLHKTTTEGEVTALCGFSGGRILAGSHGRLRLYEVGKKQLLQKSVTRLGFLRRVTQLLHVGGDTAVVGDAQASVTYVRFHAGTNQFQALVTDSSPRQVTALACLDRRTVVAGDKFGNVCVNRIPADSARDFNENVLSQFQDSFLGGPGARFDTVCEFHVQDTPTSFSKGSFVQGGAESVVYTGVQGTVGVFQAMATVQEAKMMFRLEQLVREAVDPEKKDGTAHKHSVAGRQHASFRGYYNPAKNVVDGDFVELFYVLDQATKVRVAGRLDRTPREIERKLYDLRNRCF